MEEHIEKIEKIEKPRKKRKAKVYSAIVAKQFRIGDKLYKVGDDYITTKKINIEILLKSKRIKNK